MQPVVAGNVIQVVSEHEKRVTYNKREMDQTDKPCATDPSIPKRSPGAAGIALADKEGIVPANSLVVYDQKIMIGSVLEWAEPNAALFASRAK